MNYLLSRLREPSTWSGLSMLALLAGVPPSTFGLVQQVVMGLCGLVAVVVADPAKPAPPAPLPNITGQG